MTEHGDDHTHAEPQCADYQQVSGTFEVAVVEESGTELNLGEEEIVASDMTSAVESSRA